MSLARVSALNGTAVAAKVISALVINKVIAVYLGPTGYPVIGQFQNILSVLMNLGGGIFANGLTKLTAERQEDGARQSAAWRTGIAISALLSATLLVALVLLPASLAESLFLGVPYAGDIRWLLLVFPVAILSSLFLAITNGKKQFQAFAYANIVGSLVSIVTVAVLTRQYGLYGALVAVCVSPLLILFASLFYSRRESWLRWNNFIGRCNRADVLTLARFGAMGLTAAACAPLAQMLIRDHAAESFGIASAGHWQAIWKLSEVYLMLFTSTLAVYYLPRIAEIRTSNELTSEIKKVYKFVLPLVGLSAALVFVLKDFIVTLLFSEEFLPMTELFAWQLTGDFLKIGSWIVAYVMLGRMMTRAFIVTEVLFTTTLVMLVYAFSAQFGIKGLTIAYAVNYGFYWLTVSVVVRREINSGLDAR